MEIMLKKTEGYVFNICLYHVSLKAFITNLEVVITISTDSLPTTYRQITNRRPSVDQQLAVCWPPVGQQSVEVSCSSLLPTCLPKSYRQNFILYY